MVLYNKNPNIVFGIKKRINVKVLMLALSLMLVSCGPQTKSITLEGKDGRDGIDGKNGHSLVSFYNESSELECPNGGIDLDIFLDMNDNLEADEGDIYTNSLISCNGGNGRDGLQGEQGETGQTGERGLTGSQGPQGVQGSIGPQGLVGQRGERGEEGEEGDRGATGAIGPRGATGATGAQGVAGPTGPQGSQGPAGSTGLQGLQGIQGLTGAQGQSGTNGTNATASISVTASGCKSISGTAYYSNNDRVYDNSTCSDSHAGMVADLNGGDSFWVASNKLAVDFTSTSMKIITFN